MYDSSQTESSLQNNSVLPVLQARASSVPMSVSTFISSANFFRIFLLLVAKRLLETQSVQRFLCRQVNFSNSSLITEIHKMFNIQVVNKGMSCCPSVGQIFHERYDDSENRISIDRLMDQSCKDCKDPQQLGNQNKNSSACWQ